MIPSEAPRIVEIDGTKFAAPEAVLLLLKAVSEERDQLEAENEALRVEANLFLDAIRLNYVPDDAIEKLLSYLRGTIKGSIPTDALLTE